MHIHKFVSYVTVQIIEKCINFVIDPKDLKISQYNLVIMLLTSKVKKSKFRLTFYQHDYAV